MAIKNQSGDTITEMYAILSESSPFVNVYSPNCYNGDIGVRYPSNLENGGETLNIDPFVIEVSQDAPCGDLLNFRIFFYYKTSSGGEEIFSEEHKFSLPIFSFESQFLITPEKELFQSASDHQLIGAAKGDYSIGIFFDSENNLYFGEIDFNGNPIRGPLYVSSLSEENKKATIFYNKSRREFYIVTPNNYGLSLISSTGTPTSLPLPPEVGVTSCLSSLYEEDSDDYDYSFLIVVQAQNKNSYLIKYVCENNNFYYSYASLGETVSSEEQEVKSVLIKGVDSSLPPQTFNCYFVLTETKTNPRKLKVFKFNKLLNPIGDPYETLIDNDTSESCYPSMVQDTQSGKLVITFIKKDQDNIAKVWALILGNDLTEWYMTPIITPNQNKKLLLTKLSKTFSGAYLILKEQDLDGDCNFIGKILIGYFSKIDELLSSPLNLYEATDNWYGIKDIYPIQAFETTFVLWSDSRGLLWATQSLHYFTARCLNHLNPYNVSENDDIRLSLPTKNAIWSSMAINQDSNRSMVSFINWDNEWKLFYRTTDLSGNPLDSYPVLVSHAVGPLSYKTFTFYNNGFEIYWTGYDFNNSRNGVFKWREGGYEQLIKSFENPYGVVLDVFKGDDSPCLILLKDQKQNDSNFNLYLYVENSNPPEEIQLTNLGVNSIILDGKIHKTFRSDSYPFVVTFLIKDTTSGETSLFVNYIAYIDNQWQPIFDPPCPLFSYESPLTTDMEYSSISNKNGLFVLYSYPTNEEKTLYALVLKVYEHIKIGQNCWSTPPYEPRTYYFVTRGVPEGDEKSFIYPMLRINDNGYITCSWLEKAYYTNFGDIYYFYYKIVDDYGNPLTFNTRISSLNVWSTSKDHLNVDVALTNKGALALFYKMPQMGVGEVYITELNWNLNAKKCSLYNEPPRVSTTGPYTIEYGSNLLLNGTAIEDMEMGDYVTLSGWDVTEDDTIDFIGNNINLQFSQLYEKGWVSPKSAQIKFIAKDKNNALSYASTTLNVVDTTPPLINIIYPNGGDIFIGGRSYTILWSASDNYKIASFDLLYCTDYKGEETDWIPIATNLSSNINSYKWIVPEILSSKCRIKVRAVDASSNQNVGEDISNNDFYIVQATTSSIKTIILYSPSRFENLYPGSSSLLSERLARLISNDKVNGFIVNIDNIEGIVELYSQWDNNPTNQQLANDIANTIRNYIKNLVKNVYTNAEYLIILGEDRIIPHFRIPDSTISSFSEDDYSNEVNCLTTVGSAICQNYFLTDNNYGDLGHIENGIEKEYEETNAGCNYMALPDLAIGRLIETPQQIAEAIDKFITLDGEIRLDSLNRADIFVCGWTFLNDSSEEISTKYDNEFVVDNLLGDSWNGNTFKNYLLSQPHHLNSINSHANHYSFIVPDRAVTVSEIDSEFSGSPLLGSIIYSPGCHSGLNVPSSFTNSLDIPEIMLEKGVLAHVGNTGFGWGLKHGIGYSEKLMDLITEKILQKNEFALGKVLNEAKYDYFLQDKRYDVFDEKILFESTLYGFPMFKIILRENQYKEIKTDFPGPLGPDEDEVNGIKLKKKLINSNESNALPPGVTELSLQFDFGPQTYQLINTPDGSYYKLNGRANGEAGDALQPLFVYESRLSGVVSHGVIFTGGSFNKIENFDPAIAAPQSSSPIIPPEPIAPIAMTIVPTVNVIHPTQPSSILATTTLTKMTVYTGYFDSDSNIETLFNRMNFSIYYSNSNDTTPPTILDPGPNNNLHTLNGTLCEFSVNASDASGVYRVIITYSDGILEWQSIDLQYDTSSSLWKGSIKLKRNIKYFVQAVDKAGNVRVLKTGIESGNINPETGLPYLSGARIFNVNLLDNDNDGMEDTWEIENGLNPNLNDANSDPDYDGLTNYEEFMLDTKANNADSDGDGDNDGSEIHNSRNPLDSSDGKRITLNVEKSGNNIILHFEDFLGENSSIDGPYWIYKSINDPHFDPNEILVTTPFPLPDGTQNYVDYGAGGGSDTIYYTVVNAPFNLPAPTIDVVYPSSGPVNGGTSISVYGSNFSAGATVKIGGINCTNVVVVNSTKITCKTPPNSQGPKDVVVTNLNGQSGTLVNGFTYY